jgi:hypothetical protein
MCMFMKNVGDIFFFASKTNWLKNGSKAMIIIIINKTMELYWRIWYFSVFLKVSVLFLSKQILELTGECSPAENQLPHEIIWRSCSFLLQITKFIKNSNPTPKTHLRHDYKWGCDNSISSYDTLVKLGMGLSQTSWGLYGVVTTVMLITTPFIVMPDFNQ